MATARRGALVALLLLPGALAVYTAFHGGGFFAGTQGKLAVLLAVILLLRFTVAENPFGGAGAGLALAGGALALLAAWILASASWSDAPARALLEFDRALLYVLALVLFGTLPMTPSRLAWLLRGVAGAAIAVCTVALITRTLPHVWPVSSNVANERLSYPITYWNTLGLLGALGVVLCVHFTCSERESRWVRAIAAGALPILAATIYLTFSRGAIAVGAVGVVVYLLAARPRAALGGLLASVPAMGAALAVTYGADVLATEHPATAEGVTQGRRAAIVIALCVAGAVVARTLLGALDERMAARPPRPVSRSLALGAAGATLLVVGVVFVAAGGPGYVHRQYDTFVQRKEPKETGGDLRTRLTDPSSNGRIDEWRVAIDAWKAEPLHGTGAGTYQIEWNRERPDSTIVYDGHSLYAEILGELGVVGLLLVLTALLALLAAAAVRIRGPDRALFAAAFTFLLVWGLRAGLDWDLEMPVVTLTAFCVGGAVLATPRWQEGADPEIEPRRLADPPRLMRVVLGLGCLLLALTPYRVAVSQDRLDDAVAAYKQGNCPKAIDQALASLDAEQVRPEPRLVLAYCDLRLGQPRLALNQIEAAVKRDPEDWRLRYVLAVNRALLGRDPRPEMRRARELDPLERLPELGVARFASADTPKAWQRRAQRTRLPGI
jgi:hypothetical protein